MEGTQNQKGNTNSISECLAQVVNLTKQNIAVLKAINEAFYTKKNHLAVVVDDETFTIPSFISLESRIESLEHNLENIVDAPLTGEAFTYFNGTTQRIELSGYHTAPAHVDIQPVTTFNTEINNVFKDFMTPNPFIKIDLQSIPNNIKHVVVRKVTIHENATNLQNLLKGMTTDNTIDFADVEKVLYGFTEGVDYTRYDTVKRLPIRKGVAQGEYEIVDIIDNYQDSNYDEFYELELDSDLVYHINNGTIQRDIKVGDNLVTYNDKVIMEVVDLNAIKRRVTVKVLQGAYADLQDKTSGNPSLYKLKYFKDASDNDSTKYINIPLEEDQYVIIFVSPINDTTNTQAPWGKGIFIDTNELTMDVDGKTISFRKYYDNYVNNVGDALAGITSMMNDDEQVSRLSLAQFNTLTRLKPKFSKDMIEVTQINKHLNDTKSIKTIRNLYDQKNKYKNELDTVQHNIDQINKKLSELAFDDTTNSRTVYETQLSEYNIKRSEITSAIDNIMNEISMNANNSETPIENAKYRIRGFIPTDLQELNANIPDYVSVIKLDVEYRYKNKSSFTGNAKTFERSINAAKVSVGNPKIVDATKELALSLESYIFSDWNKMNSIYRKRVPHYEDNRFVYNWEATNSDTNNPSFDQIDIPITQGEIVDIRVRFVYNLGYPFAEVRSGWSTIYTQEFPAEYAKNVEILDIISENNDDIKNRHFETLLEQKGIVDHVDDAFQDQSIKYFHKAEHITSGFFTNERRVIPLDSKLQDFDVDIMDLKSEVYGASSTNLIVTLSDPYDSIQLKPSIINSFSTMAFTNAIQESNSMKIYNSDYTRSADIAVSQLTLTLYNNGSYDMKLHSIFPGSYNTPLNISDATLFPITEYAADETKVFMLLNAKNELHALRSVENESMDTKNNLCVSEQCYNQYMYFRNKLVDVTGTPSLYTHGGGIADNLFYTNNKFVNGIPQHKLLGNELNVFEAFTQDDFNTVIEKIDSADNGSRFACMYPYIGNMSNISMNSGDTFIVLSPGESITIPIHFIYWFNGSTDATFWDVAVKLRTVSRMMAFDIRTSLYHDPITYKFIVSAPFADFRNYNAIANANTAGVHASQLPRLIASTPQTTAQNATGMSRRMGRRKRSTR